MRLRSLCRLLQKTREDSEPEITLFVSFCFLKLCRRCMAPADHPPTLPPLPRSPVFCPLLMVPTRPPASTSSIPLFLYCASRPPTMPPLPCSSVLCPLFMALVRPPASTSPAIHYVTFRPCMFCLTPSNSSVQRSLPVSVPLCTSNLQLCQVFALNPANYLCCLLLLAPLIDVVP